MKPLVLIRTDGNNKTGMGHIYRSIALSKELKKSGFQIHFLTSKNKPVLEKLRKYGQCHTTKNQQISELQFVKKINPNIIIIDLLKKFFPYNYTYMQSIKKIGIFLVTIDYVEKGNFYPDIAIHSLFRPNKYKANKVFNDIKYSVVRKEFLKSRKNFKLKKQVKSILVLQGGADTKCVSPKIVKALDKINSSLKITLILGANFKCWKRLKKTKKSLKKDVRILYDVDKIHVEMKKHDLAITAAGNSMIELMTIGIPSLIICGERHELEIAKLLHKKKAIINLGFGPDLSQKQILNIINSTLRNYPLRRRISTNSKKLIDGKGVERIATIIINNFSKISSTV